jgi:hypothetical protein
MHIDYELSERDFVYGQSQAMRSGDALLKMGFKVLILPFIGLVFIGVSFFGGTTRIGPVLVDFKSLFLGVVCVVFPLSLYLVLEWMLFGRYRKSAKVIYRSTPPLQGRLSLNVNENGIEFTDENSFRKANWPQFTKFFENRRVFVIYQRNQRPAAPPIAFDIVPKHALSPEQITELRRYLQSNIGLAKRDPKSRPFAP